MLRDEEKKAIETIKDFKNLKWYEHAFDNGTEVLDEEQKQDIEIILNLIEKQSKEIEELKEKKEELEKIVETYNVMPNKYTPNNMKLVIADMEYFKDGILKETMISKSKIKAIIEDILNSENSEAIEKLIEWHSLLEEQYND